LTSELASIIQETNDAERLEELLNVNDQLLNLSKKVPGSGKPILTLQSVDVALKNTSDSDGKLDGTPHINGRPSDCGEESSEASSAKGFEDSPTTPRIDKGKGKAEPEPEKVLSPRIQINDSEDEDEDGVPYEDALEVPGASPTDRSRSWVAEEGEVFRKGTVLLGPAEMEGEYAGEELRKELLEAMVERPPPRPLTDEFGTEVLIPGFGELPVISDRSPISPTATTPTFDMTTLKSPPKPYISRSKSSSNSSLNLISPI
jgi:protein phosphatase 1 regulatory subunit 37